MAFYRRESCHNKNAPEERAEGGLSSLIHLLPGHHKIDFWAQRLSTIIIDDRFLNILSSATPLSPPAMFSFFLSLLF